mmetsp:Transcript_9573/g.15710  ORF Transcript_9573/g.15710 Transcript_9573/m.15710 type:complete len:287 (+) Transcript_9573:55-915(+)
MACVARRVFVQASASRRLTSAARLYTTDPAPKPVAKPARVKAPPPPPEPTFKEVPNSQIRKIIAQRLQQSKQTVPHYYLTMEIYMDEVLKLRSELNKLAGSEGVKLSVNDFVIKATALALREKPTVNSAWFDTAIRIYDGVDVCVAVATEAGLITPIVRDADKKSLAAISEEVKSLAQRARDKKLFPHEFQGGTFTISNLGMYGISMFSAIINPPQSGILAVGAATKKLIPSLKPKQDGALPFDVVSAMNVTVSFDHRSVDGATGAEWLQLLKKFLEEPSLLLTKS